MRPSVLSVLLLLSVASAWPGWEDNQPPMSSFEESRRENLTYFGVAASVVAILVCIACCVQCWYGRWLMRQRGAPIQLQVQHQHQLAGYNIHPGQEQIVPPGYSG